MMKRALSLLSVLSLSGCAVLTSSNRWTPVELVHPEGLEAEVSDHVGRFAGMNRILSGTGKVATVPLSPEGLHVSIRDRSTSLWALGLLLPFLPTFGIGPDEEDGRVELALAMAYAGDSDWRTTDVPTTVHGIDPRAVRILPGGAGEPLQPVAWSVYGHHGDPAHPLPAPGALLDVSASKPLVLYFEVTHDELEAAGEFELELELEGGGASAKRESVRLRFRPGKVWHYTLLG